MKRLFALTFLVIGSLAHAGEPKKIDWPLDTGFIPVGFDSNDKVQFMAEGVFPSTCYKVGDASVDVDTAKQLIRVRQTAYEHNGTCLRIIVPFAQVIDLGLVPAGNYRIVDAKSEKELGVLEVTESTNVGPDDYLYAPVTDAFVQQDDQTGLSVLTLKGTFQDRCTSLQKTLANQKNRVIVVQPIAQRSAEADCEPSRNNFTTRVVFPKTWVGAFMLHVRTLNGQAINKIVELGADAQ